MGEIHESVLVSLRICVYMLIWFLGNNSLKKFGLRVMIGASFIFIGNLFLPTIMQIKFGVNNLLCIGLLGILGLILTYIISWI